MFFLRFETTPSLSHPEKESIERVTVLCWVQRPTLAEAIEAGQRGVRGSNYIATEPVEAFDAQREDFEDDADLLECFDMALTSNDEVLTNFEFPKDDDGDDA